MADLEKKILEVPKLPNHIQGDGRYLMSLLKSFLEQTAEQVNLANGFSAEEINPEAGGYPMPRDFFLSFTRLGGEFSWAHLSDVSELAYYELRLDTNLGQDSGLLERTLENVSYKMSVNYVDTVYLYAVSLSGEYSKPAVINYSKPRPDAPRNIAITKSSEGTLISFNEIPTNCIGAHIYVNGIRHDSNDNIFLLGSEYVEGAKLIEVAYYDSFGDGERGVLSLWLPDITGLLVERNGSQLDFYWDAVNVYNVRYVVKVSDDLSWEKGIELFRTATNDKNRYLYPNTGKYYIMVKAYDEYGNYSENAVYQLMNNEPEIDKNIIYVSDQQETIFNGSKINVFYDPLLNGITLDRESMCGEYLFNVALPQKYRARNWLESIVTVFDTSNDIVWEDGLFVWDDATQPWGGIIGDIDGIASKQQIALYQGLSDEDVFSVPLYNNLLTTDGVKPKLSIGADRFHAGRWGNGLLITDFTKIEYDVSNYSSVFSMQFNLHITKVLPSTVLVVFLNTENKIWVQLGYDRHNNAFYIRGSDNKNIEVKGFNDWRLNTVGKPTLEDSVYSWESTTATCDSVRNKGAISDWLTFGVSQTENKRCLYIYSYNKNEFLKGEVEALPVGTLTELYCYPKLV